LGERLSRVTDVGKLLANDFCQAHTLSRGPLAWSKMPRVNDSYMKNERKEFKNVLLSLSDSNYFCECSDFVSFLVRICLFGVQRNLFVLWVVIYFYFFTTVKETRYV
jgi:hypothetical protein